jgi:hypothetical protein
MRSIIVIERQRIIREGNGSGSLRQKQRVGEKNDVFEPPTNSKGIRLKFLNQAVYAKLGGNTYRTLRSWRHPWEEFSFLLNSHTPCVRARLRVAHFLCGDVQSQC